MREITYAEAIREALSEEMRSDPNVFLLGEDIGIYGGAFGVTKGMFQEFGEERVRDTPLSEHAITGAAAGAAMSGMRPVVEIMFSDFLSIALEQLANQAAKARFQFGGQTSVPMVLRTAGGSGTGAAEQHSQSLEAWVCHVPGLKVVIPATPYDAKGLLKTAIRDPNPVVFIEQKLLYRLKGPVPEPTEDYAIPLGKADIKRNGRDLTIVTYGRMVQRCLEGGREAGCRRHRGRGHRHPQPRAPGQGVHHRIGEEDGQGPHRPRGGADGRPRRRDLGDDRRQRGVLLPRRPDPQGGGARRLPSPTIPCSRRTSFRPSTRSLRRPGISSR